MVAVRGPYPGARSLHARLSGRARIGAIAYNAVHTWLAPLVLFAIGWWGNAPFLLPLAFILGAHIGFDRALGFGLKLPSGFKHTHLDAHRHAPLTLRAPPRTAADPRRPAGRATSR